MCNHVERRGNAGVRFSILEILGEGWRQEDHEVMKGRGGMGEL